MIEKSLLCTARHTIQVTAGGNHVWVAAITAQLLFAFCKILRFPQLLLGQAPESLFTACPKPNFCVGSGPVNSWRLKTVGAFRSCSP